MTGKELRKLRQKLNLTLQDVADNIGYSACYLSSCENALKNKPLSLALENAVKEFFKLKKKTESPLNQQIDKLPTVTGSDLTKRLSRIQAEIANLEKSLGL